MITKTLKKKGKKPIKFQEGGLHKSLDVASGSTIPASKMQAAMEGKFGPKAKKQALFAKNVLTGRKRGGKKKKKVNKI